jgi:hypothetical protein
VEWGVHDARAPAEVSRNAGAVNRTHRGLVIERSPVSLAGTIAVAVVVARGIAAVAFDAVVRAPFRSRTAIASLQSRTGASRRTSRTRAIDDLTAWRAVETVEEIGVSRVFYPTSARPAAHVKQHLVDQLNAHRRYIREHGEDMPSVRNWRWEERPSA